MVFYCSDWIVSDFIQLTAAEWHFWTSVISGFRREVDENCALQVYNAESSGNSLPKFRGKLSVSSSRMNFSSPLKMRPIGCPETSVRNYHYSRRVIAQRSAVLALGQVSSLIIFLTGDFAKTFGTSKLHLFHNLLYKIPNLKDCVGGGNRPVVRKFWISCSLQ